VDGFGRGSHLHLIDGSGFIFRAYHALPPLTRKSDGLPIGAVAGFSNMVWKMLQETKGAEAPTHVAVVFDKSEVTFRNDLFPEYKQNRPPAPDDLVPQFRLIRDATRAFNLPCIEMAGFEADDIIATYATRAVAAGGRVTIISADKDLMQLVGPGIVMFDTLKNKAIGRDEVIEKFGVGPERVIDVQALAGDSIDNVPGAPGIGVKTAAQLIGEYGDLDTLLARAGEIRQPKRREVLLEHAERIRVSRDLVTLRRDVPLEEPLEALEVRDPDPDALLPWLAEMEFRGLSGRVSAKLGVAAPAIEPVAEARQGPAAAFAREPVAIPPVDPAKYVLLRDDDALAAFAERIADRGAVAFEAAVSAADEMRSELVGLALVIDPCEGGYVPVAHVQGQGGLFDEPVEGQVPLETVLAILKPVLEDDAVLKIGQNVKAAVKLFARFGVRLAPIEDTMLLSYALHAGLHGHGLDYLADAYLNHTPAQLKALTGGGRAARTFAQLSPEEAGRYACEQAEVAWRLREALRPRLPFARVTRVYETLERPLVPVLGEMERHGIRVDRQALSRLSGDFAQRMAALEEEIYRLAGQRFNLGSPKQLGEVLFDSMGFAGGRKGKTGAYTTGADVLEELAAQGHDLPARMLDWRLLSKLKSTYTDTLQDAINPETGRVHTCYQIAGAATGRLASTEPNLQNIPIRSEEGRRIREAFVAEPGNVLLSLDYSQIELRILAHVAGIETLRQAFRDGVDIHALTASQMFGVPVEGMPASVRRQAKAINFGVIYGISAFGLSNNLRIPRADAQRFIDTYFVRFPGIREYMDRTIAFAKEQGHVETLFGRRIHTPEINARGPHAGFASRAAINAPIQGSAADIIRRAMIRVPAAIAGLPARMLLQVHDELLFEVEEGAVDETVAAVRRVMEAAASPAVALDVPLVVDAGAGATWAAAH
jgi:DNA polymerase-1